MTEPVYEKLTDALNMRGGAVRVIKCPEFYALLGELFTPEEGALASQMPMNPMSAADFAAEMGSDPGEVERLLEGMANKGLIYAIERGGVMEYNLLQMLPGIFELQLMKGEVNERAKRIAHLFEDYFTGMFQGVQEGAQFPQFPWARVIAVEAEIPAGMEVQPYDSVSQYIENSEYISLAICYCRHHAELMGNPCDKPKDVCMAFGEGAQFLSQRGFARLVSKEEALEALDRAEKAGLVHCSSNTSENIGFICNCCSCHCGIVQSLIKDSFMPGMGAVSSFIMMVDEEKCMGCGDCIDRCPVQVLSMQDDIVVMDADHCIGCGLCVSTCPTEALRMELRPDRPLPPRDQDSLDAALKASMGTDSPSS
jgi:electron transport complex protein RnfB